MNKLLQRQLKKFFGSLENVPKELEPFLKLISDTYDNVDNDRLLNERSFDISSREFSAMNKKLKEEADKLKASLEGMAQMNDMMINRELRMVELKKEIEALKAQQKK